MVKNHIVLGPRSHNLLVGKVTYPIPSTDYSWPLPLLPLRPPPPAADDSFPTSIHARNQHVALLWYLPTAEPNKGEKRQLTTVLTCCFFCNEHSATDDYEHGI